MSSLPPYSTYRTDNKQQLLYPQATSHGNVLTFTPPGFKQSLNVKFPDSRLAVCEKCKRNFKTRDMCRVRNNHTTAPWTTAYICLTLDDSCLDSEGKYVNKPLTVRMVQWQPYQAKGPFERKTPVCSSCKKTNRTKSFCRERHKHRHLPWCTVYVLLSALDAADPATVVADPSKPIEEENEEKASEGSPEKEEEKGAVTSPGEVSTAESKASSIDGENFKPNKGDKANDGGVGDDINEIAESRTFLAKVDCGGTSIHWLDLAEYDGDQHLGMPQPGFTNVSPAYVMPHAIADPNQHPYYHPAYTQNPEALKNHQQYFYQMQQNQFAAWQAQQYGRAHPQGHSPQGSGSIHDASSSPLPVTAGEAAAQQLKDNRMHSSEDGSGPSPPPVPPHLMGHTPPPNQGQQQWAMYPQIYPQTMPQAGPPPPLYSHRSTGHPSEGGISATGVSDSYGSSATPDGEGEEQQKKRQRRS